LLDGLPYIDQVREEYEDYAAALVEQEMQQRSASQEQLHPSLLRSKLPDKTNRTPLLETECASKESSAEQRQSSQPVPDLDRPALDPPSSENVEEWRRAVRRARLAYESERLRAQTLAAEKDESSQLWQDLVKQQLASRDVLQQAVQRTREELQAVNKQRQDDQQQVKGRELQRLETQYWALIRKQHDLKCAIAALQRDLVADE